MAIQIGGKTDCGFDNPLGLMSDCHRRIERFLDQLIGLVVGVEGRSLTEVERRALSTSLAYFRTGGPMHTADEEVSLFPRLRALNDPEVEAALEGVDRLESEHRAAEAAHAEIDELGERWLERGRLDSRESVILLRLLRTVREVYRAHIAYEDDVLFPLGLRKLDAVTIEEIGRDMAARRGLDYDIIPAVNHRTARVSAPAA